MKTTRNKDYLLSLFSEQYLFEELQSEILEKESPISLPYRDYLGSKKL